MKVIVTVNTIASIVDKDFLNIFSSLSFVNFLYFGLQVTLFYCIYVFISITAFTNFVVELCVFKGTNVPLKLD